LIKKIYRKMYRNSPVLVIGIYRTVNRLAAWVIWTGTNVLVHKFNMGLLVALSVIAGRGFNRNPWEILVLLTH
jgi:hypothetical protein